MVEVDGPHHHVLVTAAGENPAWSPTGERIAYTSGPLWAISPDGSHRVLVTAACGGSGGFFWSPDGSQLACMVSDTGWGEFSQSHPDSVKAISTVVVVGWAEAEGG